MNHLLLEFELNDRVDEVNDDRPASPPPILTSTVINALIHRGKFHRMMKNTGNE
jgi:hypothetical protein